MHHSYVSDTTRKASQSLDQSESPDYVEKNRQAWEQIALGYGPLARKAWSADQLRWGLWRLPETELGLLRFLPSGSDVVELGCGTAAISAWLTRLRDAAGCDRLCPPTSRAGRAATARVRLVFSPRACER